MLTSPKAVFLPPPPPDSMYPIFELPDVKLSTHPKAVDKEDVKK